MTVLVTGFGNTDLGHRVVEQLLREDELTVIAAPVHAEDLERAELRLNELPPPHRERVRLIASEPSHMDFGLTGPEYMSLAQELRVIHHCSALRRATAARGRALSRNLDETREVVELASVAPELDRLVYWSSAMVSGATKGYVFEDELRRPDSFRNPMEESLYRAERMIRDEAPHIPTTILRPSVIVGHSLTGAMEQSDGPYLLVQLMLNAPPDLRIPVPTRREIPLHLVPIDYVVDAGLAIARDPRSLGRTFHLVDPHPESVESVFEILSRATGRSSPRGRLPAGMAAAIMRVPGLRTLTQEPRSLLEQLGTEVIYDDRNTQRLLASTHLRCPPFEQYAETMVEHVRTRQRNRAEQAKRTSR